MEKRSPRYFVPFMIVALLALLAALWAGLVRLAWPLPPLFGGLPAAHGPLMVSGFLGTVIALERAVALANVMQAGQRRFLFAAPALAGLGTVALLAGLPVWVSGLLWVLASAGLLALNAIIIRHQTALFTLVMGVGALFWLVGNGLWLAGLPVYRVIPWWAGFLLLTIAGERLELSRMLRLSSRALALFAMTIVLLVAGALGSVWAVYAEAIQVLAGGMMALALWLLWYDVARRTVRRSRVTRFIAVCLLLGYGWLLVSGFLGFVVGGATAGFHYDAFLHTLFLGFVFGLIFGHAPLVVPALLGRGPIYHPIFYLHVILLHLSLLLRVAGDLRAWLPGRQWGGLLNEVAVLLFLVSTLVIVRRSLAAASGATART